MAASPLPISPERAALLQRIIDLHAGALLRPREKWLFDPGAKYWEEIEEIRSKLRPLSRWEAAVLLDAQARLAESLRQVTAFMRHIGPGSRSLVAPHVEEFLHLAGRRAFKRVAVVILAKPRTIVRAARGDPLDAARRVMREAKLSEKVHGAAPALGVLLRLTAERVILLRYWGTFRSSRDRSDQRGRTVQPVGLAPDAEELLSAYLGPAAVGKANIIAFELAEQAARAELRLRGKRSPVKDPFPP